MIKFVQFLISMSYLVAGPKVEVMSVGAKKESILVTAKNFARAETDEYLRKISFTIEKETGQGSILYRYSANLTFRKANSF